MGLHFETGTHKESERVPQQRDKARAVQRPPFGGLVCAVYLPAGRQGERPVAGRGEMTALDFFDYFFDQAKK